MTKEFTKRDIQHAVDIAPTYVARCEYVGADFTEGWNYKIARALLALADENRELREALDRVGPTILEHWPVVMCNETTHTDACICGCALWHAPEMPSMGEARQTWVEHFRAALEKKS